MKTRRDSLGFGASHVLRWLRLSIFTAAGFCWAMSISAQSVPNRYWQAQNIYQIITDRFYDGDTNNDNVENTYDPSGNGGSSVHGGDFEGIEQKLDYIKALGVTAIW